MALKGAAFLAMWHDIRSDAQNEYTEWHTREHMPERLGIPGFRVGKRFVNHDFDRHQYGTIYSGDDLEVFRSPAYLERLNNPTDWSNKLQPTFQNFLRVACERVLSVGTGDGGAIATVRLDFAEGSNEAAVRNGARALAEAVYQLPGVTCVHFGVARPEFSSVKTRETELRPKMSEKAFDAVLVVEGNGRPELAAIVGQIEEAVSQSDCGLANPFTQIYYMAYQLTSEDLAADGAGQ